MSATAASLRIPSAFAAAIALRFSATPPARQLRADQWPGAAGLRQRSAALVGRIGRSSTLIGLAALALGLAQAPAQAVPVTPIDGQTACTKGARLAISARPAQVNLGQSTTLIWSMTLPPGCEDEVLILQLNGAEVPASGRKTITPVRSAVQQLKLLTSARTGAPAARLAGTSVGVLYPTRVLIGPTTPNPVQTLLGALDASNANPMQVVELCNVDLDLTGQSQIALGNNRSLIASPGCARGARSYGSRLRVSDRRSADSPLFLIRSDNVEISGFRLEGPSPDIGSDRAHNTEIGILVWPLDTRDPITNIRLTNLEVLHWSGAGISVIDNADATPRGRLTNQNPGGVRISHSYFHHNRHSDGFGYGVVVGMGAYALIERNVFEQNRHAIAGDSGNGRGDWSGYTISENLILPGGGVHCSVLSTVCSRTHQIDMHGDQDLPLNPFCCGTAGETLLIRRNTLLYTGGLRQVTANGPALNIWDHGAAIKIRGNPADQAVVDGNVFKLPNSDAAIVQNGSTNPLVSGITNPVKVLANNVFGADTMATLGQCDFVGDGRADAFMATGVTWWARSPVTQHWRFLNAMPGALSQLLLGDVDGDGRCDVAIKPAQSYLPPRQYSSAGSGGWQTFGVQAR